MARQGQSDIEIADETFKECWDQFQNWAARHISETLRFDQLANLDDEDEEELDESLFQASLQSGTAHKVGQELRALYYDPVEIDLEDELLEPTVGPSPSSAHWMNRFTTKTIPQYSSFSHLRQQNYIRGDIWVQTRTGERIRVATGDDEEIEVQVQAQIEDEKKKRGKGKGKGKKNDDKEPEPEPPVMVNEGRMDPVDARRRIRKQKLVNLGVGDNPANNQESMPFIPPEMKRRNAKNIMLSYEASFLDIEAWQHFTTRVFTTPTEDIIGAETIRRLLYIHKMTEDRIDETKAIPQDISALFKTLRHRTYPDLDIIFAQDPPLPHLSIDEWCHKEEQATLESRVREKAFHICYKIDCQGIMCPTHYTACERALTEQEAHETVEAQEADNRRGRGPQTPRWRKPTVSPDARVQADIETIWRVDPDAMPCDVAELSWDKVTCRQAYDIRNRLYSDLSEPEPDEDHPEFEERRGGGSIRKHTPHLKNAITLDLATRTLTALAMLQTDIAFGTPPGTDTLRAGKQRRRGCDCKADSKTDTCRTEGRNGCKCYKRGMECDPDLCTGCKARWRAVYERWDPDEAMEGRAQFATCLNLTLLTRMQQTVVKPSQYGNGLFLVGNVVKNTLISDQQTTRATFAFRELLFEEVADATHRNYLFDIPNYSGLTIDAGYAGNESRFANHPSNGNANCGAKYVWVGNEKHIALYATGHIWNGNELFLHYGSRYWNSEMPGGEPGAADPGEQDSDELGSEVDELYDEIEDTEQEVEYEAEESSDSSVDL
ncbi:SET domain-containing protein [Rhizoctonia solani AG-1 IA]|uniref:SET domain-containing protein n=1 Tax=Thanatephorus cucumeris (strain AG1-IA) TaxID=983506 RepID=L8WVV9_THACA|nr:SET domain-containing protein [Rhizoctonia solani AG-1 IA]